MTAPAIKIISPSNLRVAYKRKKYPDVKLIIVDLFCGAGGTTLGYEKAFWKAKKLAKVIACVNHDADAIFSHKANHRGVRHFNEDIRTLDLTELIALVKMWREICPNAKLVLWASLECTNHSRAKGGLPKDEDSRTLAWDLYRYVEGLNPDYIKIENVTEFKIWGPLDDDGHPIKEEKGVFFEGWRHHIRQYGYTDSWTELNAADFGAYQARNRLFGCFAKPGLPLIFPQPTHAKKTKKSSLKQWKAVRDVLELDDVGLSIFSLKYVKSRKMWKPRITSDKTFRRVLSGLSKFVANGDTSFIASYYNGSDCVSSIDSPAPTLTVKDRLSLLNVRLKEQLTFIVNYYTNGGELTSIYGPAGSVLPNPKQSLVTCRPFLTTQQYGDSCVHLLDKPSPTLIASMDKTEFKVVSTVPGTPDLAPDEWDTPNRLKVKLFMYHYGIAELYIRGLKIPELKRIQGFPDDYVLKGSQKDQKKFIGNAVHKDVVVAWVRQLCRAL